MSARKTGEKIKNQKCVATKRFVGGKPTGAGANRPAGGRNQISRRNNLFSKPKIMYTKKVEEHFKHPRNMGELPNPTASGQAGNPVCGDIMQVQLEIKNDTITDAKFKTFGCAAAIATTSALTELIKGKTIAEAEKITFDDIVEYLGGLPPIKMHCSQLALNAFHEALTAYKKKSK